MFEHFRLQNAMLHPHSWTERGGYHGTRLPASRFDEHFGVQHPFHIERLPGRVSRGYPEFRIDGYWVTLFEPVPSDWAANWYVTDLVSLIELEDGYYLADARYPGVRIAIGVDQE